MRVSEENILGARAQASSLSENSLSTEPKNRVRKELCFPLCVSVFQGGFDTSREVLNRKGFRQEGACSRGHRLGSRIRSVPGDDHHGNVVRVVNRLAHLQSVHLGHLPIHQDNVGRARFHGFHRFVATCGLSDFIAESAECYAQRPKELRVVIDN